MTMATTHMKTILLTFLATLSVQWAAAQSFALHWIGASAATCDQQLWFRHNFFFDKTPKTLFIQLASTGNYCLYVNQYNVSRNVLLPFRSDKERSLPAEQTFDLTPYLRPDTNTVAIWYAPTASHKRVGEPQIAACIFGTDEEGNAISYTTSREWLWSYANASLSCIDATAFRPDWNAATHTIIPWSPAEPTPAPHERMASTSYRYRRVAQVYSPIWTQTTNDSLRAGFPTTVRGWIRITLRETQPGERIVVNGLTYICSGTMDEQVCRRFSTETKKEVTITGDKRFKPGQVQNIEGLMIEEFGEE